MNLTEPMRDLLWIVAQHKYGWAHCPNSAGRVRRSQTAEALERRGLVVIDRRQPHMPMCSATDAGRAEIERRWPVSPFVLGTYEHQKGGWTPREGCSHAFKANPGMYDTMHRYCVRCGIAEAT